MVPQVVLRRGASSYCHAHSNGINKLNDYILCVLIIGQFVSPLSSSTIAQSLHSAMQAMDEEVICLRFVTTMCRCNARQLPFPVHACMEQGGRRWIKVKEIHAAKHRFRDNMTVAELCGHIQSEVDRHRRARFDLYYDDLGEAWVASRSKAARRDEHRR